MMNAQVRSTVLARRPAAGEADGGRAERRDGQERVRPCELLVARHLGDQAVVGGIEELLHAGIEEQQDVQARAGRCDSMPMTKASAADDDRLDQAGRDEDPLAVVAIDEDAGEQPDDQAGDGRDHQGQADREGRLGLAVDVDAGSEVRQRRAGGRDELRQPQQGEVAPPEHGEHGWGRRARDAHRTSTGAGDGARPSPRSRRSGSHDDTGSGGVYWPRRATVTPSRRSIASLRDSSRSRSIQPSPP